MEILIISGLSGAGKSSAATYLEDMGYFTMDNVPADIVLKFAAFCSQSDGRYDRVALVSDIRSGDGDFSGLLDAMDRLKQGGDVCRLLFVTADLETIIKRYKETRRRHPLMSDGMSIEQAMHREEELLRPLRERADVVIDTTQMPAAKLRNELYRIFGDKSARGKLSVSLTCAFCPIPSMCRSSSTRRAWTARSTTTCFPSRRRRPLSKGSRGCCRFCCRFMPRRGRARLSSPSAARAGTTEAFRSRDASRRTYRGWGTRPLKIIAI